MPASAADILLPRAEESPLLSSGMWMVTAFLLASNGMHALLVSSDTLFGFKHSNYLLRRIKALILAIVFVSIAVGSVLLISSSFKFYVSGLAENGGRLVQILLVILKWFVITAGLFLLIKMIHRFAPRYRIPGKYTNIGAMFTTLGWICATSLYSYYLNHYNNNYDDVYGDFTNVILLVMWMYILSYILVFGIALNAYLYRKNKNNTIKDDLKANEHTDGLSAS